MPTTNSIADAIQACLPLQHKTNNKNDLLKKKESSDASTEASDDANEIRAGVTNRSSLCDVSISMTIQNMLTLDPENMTYTAMFEIDFKYRLKDYIDLFQLHDKELDAENFQFPFIICNTVETEELRSNHFFRVCDENTKASDVSMYGDPINVKSRLTNENDVSKAIKCEKYCLVGTYRYHSNGTHQPFDEIFTFFKIATDGRPGTEYLTLKFHDDDSSFVAFRKQVRDYVAVDDPVALDVDMSHEYNESSGPTYPRVYLFQRFRHRSLEDFLKFYLLPSCLPILLIFSAQDNGSDSIIETVALSSGLILSDIALLFVNDSPDLTFSEQSLIFNLAYLIFGSIFSSIIGDTNSISEKYRFSVIVVVTLSMPLSMLLAMYHRYIAEKDNKAIVNYLKKQNFDKLKDLV
mmetsp:Transcript_16726/g.31694  ORF Transcript_16726/g.31694 Transcript_16726/m.31694 type:complete len:407 (-) Transcript_16726:89-1309(-)